MRSVIPRRYMIGPIKALKGSAKKSQKGLIRIKFIDDSVKSVHTSVIKKAYLCEGGYALLVESRATDYYRWLPRPMAVFRRLGAIGDYFCEECGPSWTPFCSSCEGETRPRILWRDSEAVVTLAQAVKKGSRLFIDGIEVTPWEVMNLYKDLTGALYAEVIFPKRFDAKPVGDLLPVAFKKPLEVKA
jgi:hypothetical protein